MGIESTGLSLAGGRAVLLRPGMVSQAAVIGPAEFLGRRRMRVLHDTAR